MRFPRLFLAFAVTSSLVVLACSSDTPAPSNVSSSSSGSSGSLGPSSFKNDVVPILVKNCALVACHAAKESHLGIHLTQDKEQLYSELQKSSPTLGFNSAKFIIGGKPEESLLMAKMDGTQANLSECTKGCGNEMPPGELIKVEDRDMVRAWIQDGAKND